MGFRLGAEFLATAGEPALIGSGLGWTGLGLQRLRQTHRPPARPQALQHTPSTGDVHGLRSLPSGATDSRAYYQHKRDAGKQRVCCMIRCQFDLPHPWAPTVAATCRR